MGPASHEINRIFGAFRVGECTRVRPVSRGALRTLFNADFRGLRSRNGQHYSRGTDVISMLKSMPYRLPSTWKGLTNLATTKLATAPDSFPTMKSEKKRKRLESTGGPAKKKIKLSQWTSPLQVTGKRRALVAGFEHLVEGVKLLHRGPGPEGQEQLLTPREQKRLSTLLKVAPEETLTRLSASLKPLRQRDTLLAAGVFLRAVGVRSPFIGTAQQEVLDAFALRLGACSDEEITAKSTCLDLDSTTNKSTLNPTALSYRRGTIHTPYEGDNHGDNDGLFQRFTGSCGPTVLQMWLAETDPVLAFELNRDDIGSHSTTDRAGHFQKVLLNQYEGIALGRFETLSRARLRNGLGRLVGEGRLRVKDKKGLLGYALEEKERSEEADRAINMLRERYEGFPTDYELNRLRSVKMPEKDDGMSNEGFMYFLNHCAQQMTGTRYIQTDPEWGFGRGQAKKYIGQVAKALRAGYDVPFGTAEPGHYMLLTAVKGRGATRSFLVSDPEGGRTRWVSEKRFLNGVFLREEFELCWKQQRGYVDGFFLPEATLS